MIGKNNQNLKNKKEGVKIESYSIKKFKVGAASVVIGASIFFGAAGVANAAEVSGDKAEKNTDVEKVNSSTDRNTDVLNNKISTEKEVAKPAKKEEVAVDATPTVNNNANADKKVEKKELDKNTLKTNIEKVEELLEKINKDKAPASTLAAIKIDLENAKNILNSTDAELTQAEIDALVKKLSEKISVLSSMPKANTPEKVVKEGKNTIANSGSRDSRNGQSMEKGTQFRAGTQIDSGALKDIKYYASVDPSTNGGNGTRNDDPDFTENKTVIKAFYQEDSAGKWIVYDVFFNNDGRKMTDKSYGQHYYFQPPFNIMDPANIVKDLSFTRYRKNGGTRLSDGFQGFEQYGNSAEITNPWIQKQQIFNGDRRTFYDPNSGVARENQKPQVFKNNANDPILNEIVRKKDGNYTGGVTYNLGIEARQESTDYAVHMHAKVKLKNDVTENEANAYGRVFAASVTSGPTTNQSYVVGTRGTSLKPKDTIPPTITANNSIVIKNEKIVDIPVTATDNVGGVGMRPNSPIEVTGLPQGLTFANGKITGTPTGPVGNSTVTIKAYDKNGNKAEKTITITVKDQASKYNPTGETLAVNQGQPITDDAVKAKVKNYGPGTLKVVSKPSTAKPGNVGSAVVQVTYPDGSSENVNVPVTVLEAPDNQPPTLTISPANQTVVEGEKVTFTLTARDNKIVNLDNSDFLTKYGSRLINAKATATNVKDTDTEKIRTITITTTAEDVGKTNTITFNATDNANHKATPVSFTFTVTKRDILPPTITAADATVTKNEPITPIPLTAVDNTGGVGLRDKNPIEVSNLPQGLTYANNQITGTPTGEPGNSTVMIKAYDKNGNMATKTITITVKDQASKYNPTGETLTVNQGQPITDDAVKSKVKNYGPGTLTVESKPISTTTAGNAGNAVVKVTYPDGSSDIVNVPVTVKDVTGPTITAENATVTKNEPITPIPVIVADNEGGRGLREENPVVVTDLPDGLTYANGEITGTPTGNKGDYTVTIKAHDKDGNVTTQTITIKVQEQADIYTPKYDDGEGKPGGTVELPLKEKDGKEIPEKTKFQSDTPGITVDDKGKVTVAIPKDKNPGDVITGKVTVTYPDGSKDEVPVSVTVTDQDKDIYTPEYDKGNGKPGGNVELPLKEKEGKTIPGGTKFESNTPGITVDKDGKVTVTIPEGAKPGDKITGEITVTYPDGSKDIVPVEVTVTNQDKDIYTPEYDKENGKPGTKVEVPLKEKEGKTIPKGTKFESNTPGITVDKDGKVTVTIPEGAKPGDKITGEITVTYPDGSKDIVPVEVTVTNQDKDIYTPKYDDGKGKPGAKVEIPLTEENGKKIPGGTTFESDQPGVITVDDKGKVIVTIPKEAKPGDKITGKVTVTYPDGSKEEVPVNVTVTTPAKLTPTVELEQNSNTGDVTVTPKRPDGSIYPPGTKVEIPGKDKDHPITVTIGEDGKGTVPNSELPEGKVPGTGKITEPGKPTEEVPNVETPSKIIPGAPTTEQPVEIEITRKPNGDAVVTPKKPDGSTYPPGTKVEIPGKDKNDNPITITVTIGDNGSGEVPNDNLPKKDVPGTGTVTEPNKNPSKPVDVTTPARKTPTVELEQNPNTGDVTVTPKRPDGSTYPPGTKVEIPGKNGNTITVTIGEDGKGTVPNSDLPDVRVPGVAKITEPGKPTVEVPVVTTPAKLTPTVEVPVVTTPAKIRASEKGELQSQKSSDNKENSIANKSTKRLANTGESETNTGLAGLGLAMLGSLLAAVKKRREDKE